MGSMSGKHHSEETKKKISEGEKLVIREGRKRMIGMLGKHHSIATRLKISNATRKQIREKGHPLLGKRMSDISRLHMSISQKGKNLSEHTKTLIHLARLKQVFPFQNTKIEIMFQEELLKNRIDFVAHYPVFGQPDIFIEPNVCIFIDGCYWHGCCEHNSVLSSHQISRRARDEIVNFVLLSKNYRVLRFWEHEVLSSIENCMIKLKSARV